MTNKTEMVSVPRELLTELKTFLEEAYDGGLEGILQEDCGLLLGSIGPLLAAPAEDVRAVVEEPVSIGTLQRDVAGRLGFTETAKDAYTEIGATIEPLYRNPHRPVVLPERFKKIMQYLLGEGDLDGYYFRDSKPSAGKYWWRAELRSCLDAVEELNK